MRGLYQPQWGGGIASLIECFSVVLWIVHSLSLLTELKAPGIAVFAILHMFTAAACNLLHMFNRLMLDFCCLNKMYTICENNRDYPLAVIHQTPNQSLEDVSK